MPDVPLTMACVDYLDRTRPLIEGQVETPGIDLTCVPLAPMDLGARWAEFDVAEAIVPVYLALRSRGDEAFVAIPVFPYRAFFLSNIIVTVASGIANSPTQSSRAQSRRPKAVFAKPASVTSPRNSR